LCAYRASQSVSKRNENPSVLAKKLKISEWINKVVYSNDEINFLDDGSSQYIADGASGLVAFQIQFVVKDMEVC
jgi:O-acetylhomoserine/O-acetylserine sulfhydrylase-like pyridoxal-dependent enzyme